MKKQVVYIAGLSRVDSTLLDLILGCQHSFVGLGEIYQVLRSDLERFDQKIYCSCGSLIDECPFWGKAAVWLRKNREKIFQEKFEKIISIFYDVFGENTILVDSSKLINILKVWTTYPDIELKVLYLIRDVRAWTASRLNSRTVSPDYFSRDGGYMKKLKYHYGSKIEPLKWFIPYISQMPSYFFQLWYYQNKRMKKFLDDEKISYFCLGYEELAMYPDAMLTKIFEFLKTDGKQISFSTEHSGSHILVGNVKKTDPNRRKDFFYDNRWMYRNDLNISTALFPHIMRYNSKEVYKNIRNEAIWG